MFDKMIKFQTGAERRVTFDHGPDGSVAEDNYFGMVALREGYSFDFIEGEMWEKSPFTIYDFLQQRKRWLQGILLVVHSPHIPVSSASYYCSLHCTMKLLYGDLSTTSQCNVYLYILIPSYPPETRFNPLLHQ